MIEGRNMETESSTGRLRVAIIGPEKNGKSVLASTSPGIKLFLDFDQRAEAVAGKKGVYAITFKDPGGIKMPEAAEEVLDVMNGLSASLDLSQLKTKRGQPVFPQLKTPTIIDGLIFDSMSSFAKMMMDYETYNNADLCRKVKIGPGLEVRVPRNYDAWRAEMDGVGSAVFQAFALPINVFCIFHEVAEEALDSTDEKPKYTGKVSIYPVRYKSLLKYFNEVWRVRLTPIPSQSGQRYLPRVYPLPDYTMDAATTMLLDPVEEPNIEAMIQKHNSRNGVKK
jgi:hypothetical protein